MGCTNSKEFLTAEKEESIIREFENDLGFGEIKVCTIPNIFKGNSKCGLMTKMQLEYACSQAKVNLMSYDTFLSHFFDGNRFIAKKLICLGILLGQGDTNEKISLLYENYDSSRHGFMPKSAIEEIITDIIEISCIKIPAHVLKFNKLNSHLRRYTTKLSITVSSMISHHNYIFASSFDRITIEEFRDILKNDRLLHLLNSRLIRIFAMQMFYNLTRPAEKAIPNIIEVKKMDHKRNISEGSSQIKKIKYSKSQLSLK